jgi:histone H3/H4
VSYEQHFLHLVRKTVEMARVQQGMYSSVEDCSNSLAVKVNALSVRACLEIKRKPGFGCIEVVVK